MREVHQARVRLLLPHRRHRIVEQTGQHTTAILRIQSSEQCDTANLSLMFSRSSVMTISPFSALSRSLQASHECNERRQASSKRHGPQRVAHGGEQLVVANGFLHQHRVHALLVRRRVFLCNVFDLPSANKQESKHFSKRKPIKLTVEEHACESTLQVPVQIALV